MSIEHDQARAAVRKRQQLINFLSASTEPRTALELMSLGQVVTAGQYASARAIQQRLIEDLTGSDLYLGTSEICHILNQSAASYLTSEVFATDILVPNGMVYFTEPVTPVADSPDKSDYFRAITWSVISPDVYDTDNHVVLIIGYHDGKSLNDIAGIKGLPDLYPAVSVLWEIGKVGGGEFGYSNEGRFQRSPYVKLLLAYWAIVRQRLTVQEELRTKPLPKMVKASKGKPQAGTRVKIIKMRPRNKGTTAAGGQESGGRDWQVSWIVRPHWRMQWYPASEEHKPILILAYTKGPEDKPMVGTERAFLPPAPLEDQ